MVNETHPDGVVAGSGPTEAGVAIRAEIERLIKDTRGLANGLLGVLSWTVASVCILLLPAMFVGLVTDVFRFRAGSSQFMPSIVAVSFLMVMGGTALGMLLYLDRIASVRARRLVQRYGDLFTEGSAVPVWYNPRWTGQPAFTLGPDLAPIRSGTASLIVVAQFLGVLLTIAGGFTLFAGDLESYTYGISTLAVAALTFGYAVRTGLRLRRIRRAQVLPSQFIPSGRPTVPAGSTDAVFVGFGSALHTQS